MRPALLLVCAAHLLVAADFTLVYVALPAVGDELGLDVQALQWVMHAYTLCFGLPLLPFGGAADRIGRLTLFVAGLLLLGGACCVAALAGNAATLIGACALQGLACAMLFPAMLGLISEETPPGAERERAIALWSAAGPCGLAAGTLLGGVLLDALGWRGVFLAAAPVCLACAALSVAGAFRHARFGAASPAAAQGAGGLLAGALRLVRQYGNLRAGMALTAAIMGTFMAMPYFHTQLLQRAYGFDGMQTGLAFLVPCIAQAAGARLAAPAIARVGLRASMATGLVLGSVSLAALGFATSATGGFASMAPWLALASLGQGVAWAGTWIVISGSVADRDQGLAAALASTTFQVGGAAGLAALVALSSLAVPAGAPPAAAALLAARAASFTAAAGILLAAWVALRVREARPATQPHSPSTTF